MPAPINVLYIAGSGRSGSTLLDRVLGQAPEMTSLGEMRYLWSFGLIDDNLCECGRRFGKCPFWSDVVAASLGSPTEERREEWARIAGVLDRAPAIPWVRGWAPASAGRRAQIQDHVHRLDRLYRAAADRASTAWLVDSSKAPAYGFLIARIPGIRLHVVHLVRDSRAVANSWQRKRLRPEITSGKVYMPRRPTILTALRWNYSNLLDQALGRVADGYLRLNYEEFVRSPRESIRHIREAVGLAPEGPGASLTDRSVQMSASHTLAGNPNRFDRGEIRFKLDDAWRTELSPGRFTMVTLATLPQLLYYGYRLSRRVPDAM
jgi:hypothetical protein